MRREIRGEKDWGSEAEMAPVVGPVDVNWTLYFFENIMIFLTFLIKRVSVMEPLPSIIK